VLIEDGVVDLAGLLDVVDGKSNTLGRELQNALARDDHSKRTPI
jgi:hypothetical protein